jgi:hypothetical protein
MESPFDEVKTVYEELLPNAMTACVPIIPTSLDGTQIPNCPPKYLGTDIAVYDKAFGIKTKDLKKYSIN